MLETASGVTCGPRLNSGAAKTKHSRSAISLLFAAAAFWFGSVSVLYASQANVFVYHRFNDARYPSTNISAHEFRAHLDTLQNNDFQVLTLGAVVERLRQGRALPSRCAVITIDDAYRSFLTDGWPLLQQYGYAATLFVSTDTVGGADYLTWAELKSLQEQGVELGNHSAAHAYLLDHMADAGWRENVRTDLDRSREAFAAKLGTVPQLFAYPYGEYSPELVELVKQAGFIAAFGQQSGVITPEQDLFALPRFPVAGSYAALGAFRSKLFMKPLPLEVVSPKTPVLMDDKTPKLIFSLKSGGATGSALNCFIQGQDDCRVRRVAGEANLFEVEAVRPLAGRRSKYTVTATDQYGSWYWFSQLWIMPRR